MLGCKTTIEGERHQKKMPCKCRQGKFGYKRVSVIEQTWGGNPDLWLSTTFHVCRFGKLQKGASFVVVRCVCVYVRMAMAVAEGWGWWGLAAFVTALVVRVCWVVGSTGKPVARQRPVRTVVVLGSGGHTAEMMSLVEAMDLRWYAPRYYVAGATDNMSLSRAQRVEAQLLKDIGDADKPLQRSQFCQIYRSREVGQSYLTSIFTTLWAFVHAVVQVLRIQPDVILCNGPGTCLPICVAGFLMKVVGWKRVVVVYVESIARVKKLSLTGLLLYKLRLADQFFVQWQDLKVKYPRANYVGRLM